MAHTPPCLTMTTRLLSVAGQCAMSSSRASGAAGRAVAVGASVGVAGTVVAVGCVIAVAVGPCVGTGATPVSSAKGDAVGSGNLGAEVAVGVSGNAVAVSVGRVVAEAIGLETEPLVAEGSGALRHAARKVPTAARPRLTNRRRDMRPSKVNSGSWRIFSSDSGFTKAPI